LYEAVLVANFDFDLRQDCDDPFCTVLVLRHSPTPSVPVSETSSLAQNSPVTSRYIAPACETILNLH